MPPTALLLSSPVASHSFTSGNSIQQATSSYPSPDREGLYIITNPVFLFFYLIHEFLLNIFQSFRLLLNWLNKQGLCKVPFPLLGEAGWGPKKLFIIILLIPISVFSQQDSVQSGAYKWSEPITNKKNKIASTVLLEGKVYDFEWMQINANKFSTAKDIKLSIPSSQEQLIIIRSGACTIKINDSVFSLTPGSVAVLMPGQKYSLKKSGRETCNFFTMKYRSKQPVNLQRGGSSFVKIWETIPYKPNTIGGGRRDFFNQPTAMQKRFEMHVTTLKEGVRSHDPHTHRAEEIVFMIEGDTEMQFGDTFYKGKIGDFYFLGSNVLHVIKNVGIKPCMYFAFQFE